MDGKKMENSKVQRMGLRESAAEKAKNGAMNMPLILKKKQMMQGKQERIKWEFAI
jgi:hypothetical protein